MADRTTEFVILVMGWPEMSTVRRLTPLSVIQEYLGGHWQRAAISRGRLAASRAPYPGTPAIRARDNSRGIKDPISVSMNIHYSPMPQTQYHSGLDMKN